jgi:hypothetical protein
MTDPSEELGGSICAILVACKQHERRLRAEAAKRGTTYESVLAAALASAILEKSAATPRSESDW